MHLLLQFASVGLLQYFIWRWFLSRWTNATKRSTFTLGFFHPYCNAGGGGERVLWTAIQCLQSQEPNVLSLVYTGDLGVSKEAILRKVEDRFGIALDPTRIDFVKLKRRWLVEDATWPRFTLAGQSLGSIALAHEALSQAVPDVFIDTMGYAFCYPLVKLLIGVPVMSYTHYPTISTDMIQRVSQRVAGHTNTGSVASSWIRTQLKLCYYRLFQQAYTFCLRRADCLLVNSTWTNQKVSALLGSVSKPRPVTLYPPCDVTRLSTLDISAPRDRVILSVAQFRPEKEHAVQIQAMKALQDADPALASTVSLILAGSVRNAGDEARVESLKALARSLDVFDKVQFAVNVTYDELLQLFGRASIGLSTMVDEHFGINVVELLGAGIIPIVHPSAGPLLDIVVPFKGQPTGYHASTPQEFAQKMALVFNMTHAEQYEMRARARQSVSERFSAHAFEEGWISHYHQTVAAIDHVKSHKL